MKKALLPVLILLLLSGCKIKDYTPEIPIDFTSNATVTSGDFSFNCEICKNESAVSVTISDTNAQGMVMTYDGENLTLSYSEFSSDFSAENFDGINTAVVLFDVFRYIQTAEETEIKKTEQGFKYTGKTDVGSFTLLQNNDGSFSTLTFQSVDYKIKFES
ncbi:MAG: hypothetical protein LIO62_05755 [Clostridiales bacterium]|nr:hypothetical protein [Clostridiales bacterium]